MEPSVRGWDRRSEIQRGGEGGLICSIARGQDSYSERESILQKWIRNSKLIFNEKKTLKVALILLVPSVS